MQEEALPRERGLEVRFFARAIRVLVRLRIDRCDMHRRIDHGLRDVRDGERGDRDHERDERGLHSVFAFSVLVTSSTGSLPVGSCG